MKLTRRQMVVAATAGSAVAVKALAQSGAAAPVTDFEKQARDNVRNNGEALAKFQLSPSVEPAFQFKA